MEDGGSSLGAVFALRWLLGKLAELRGLTSSTIGIHIPIEFVVPEIKLGLCYVRDGKEQTSGQVTSIKNKALPFNAIDGRGHLQCSVQHKKRLGFQFKCYVDHSTMPRDRVISLLTTAGFEHPSIGEGKPNRIWFILPDYATHSTADNPPLLNNFFYPE